MRAVVLYPGQDGYWVAECPSLPGCISQGSTKPEALSNVKEAIEGWLETAEAHGQSIPDQAGVSPDEISRLL
jgi:predicted RNase H-like HicB family nuclease